MVAEQEWVETRIYLISVSGSVTIDDMKSVVEEGIQSGRLRNEIPYAQIVDLSNADRIPVNVRGFREIGALMNGKVMGLFVIDAPPAARLAAQVVKKLFPVFRTTWFFDSQGEAIAAARLLVAEADVAHSARST
jgi:hypothetical protein